MFPHKPSVPGSIACLAVGIRESDCVLNCYFCNHFISRVRGMSTAEKAVLVQSCCLTGY